MNLLYMEKGNPNGYSLEESLALLGDWLYQSRTSSDTLERYNSWAQENRERSLDEVNRPDLTYWIRRMGWGNISADMIGRIENKALKKEPGIRALWILHRSGILKVTERKDGEVVTRSATFEEIVRTAIGYFNPFEERQK